MGLEYDPHDKTAATRLGITVEEYTTFRAEGLKHCMTCRAWLPSADAFGRDCSRYDNRATRCRACCKKDHVARRDARARNQERECEQKARS